MFRSICGCGNSLHLRWKGESTTHFYPLKITSLKSISHISKSTIQDYLVNSCGLSQESALKAAQQINIKTLTKPDSVLKFFQNYGFTNTQIAKLITKYPPILLADPNKYIKPKIEFFRNNGISDPILAKKLSGDPNILKSSLEKRIIPSFNYIKSFLRTNENIAIAFGRTTRIFHNLPKQSITFLQNHGVPESIISKILMTNPRTLIENPDKFSENVLKILEMGFDPSSLMFAYGLCTFSGMNKGIWEAKLAVYKSFGWTEDEILSVFRKQPVCMVSSEKKISTALDFFMNKLNWTPADISKYPTTLFLSLEKRIMPRCSVFEVLLSKGLMKKGEMGNALIKAEDVFLKNYVFKYQNDLPQLLKIYQKKMGVCECLSLEKGLGN